MYAVFDANNFYVSCERVVNPKLKRQPVIVANPGGIVLARSEEAKALGVKMAAPLFKIQDLVQEKGIKVATTRFAIYTDLSVRIASILHQHFPIVEEYSIDESFVYFSDNLPIVDIEDSCKKVRKLILQWTGIPVSVGISSTKTLSKVAVKIAKKHPDGVMSITSDTMRKEVLSNLAIGDIWGVGWALGKKLPAYGINKAMDLANKDPLEIRRKFSVTLAYTINELNGIACFTIDNTPKPAKSLMRTESYHEEITQKEVLIDRLRALSTSAGKQLRKQGEVAGGMGVFVRGNRFHKERGYVASQEMTIFAPPTANTPTFYDFIDVAMDKIFFAGIQVKRAGVYFFDLTPKEHRQYGLFEGQSSAALEKDEKAMKAIDEIEKKWGRKKGTFLTIQI